jgi:phage-related protein
MAFRIAKFANEGRLRVPEQHNRLTPNIEELKTAYDRLPFYRQVRGPRELIRVTHGFPKRSEKTPAHEIAKAEAIRKVDVERGENDAHCNS